MIRVRGEAGYSFKLEVPEEAAETFELNILIIFGPDKSVEVLQPLFRLGGLGLAPIP